MTPGAEHAPPHRDIGLGGGIPHHIACTIYPQVLSTHLPIVTSDGGGHTAPHCVHYLPQVLSTHLPIVSLQEAARQRETARTAFSFATTPEPMANSRTA